MSFHFRSISRLFCSVTLCATLAGCSTAPQDTVVANATDNAATGNSATNAPDSAETASYANSSQGLKGKLKENYVDFSFKYPQNWQLRETGRGDTAQNFVKIERGLPDKSKGEFTLENLAVSYFSPSKDAARNKTLVPQTARQLSDRLSKEWPGYKKISEGPTKVGEYPGYEFRFEGLVKDSNKGDIKLWGRAILLPNPKTAGKGVSLLMLASSLAPEIESAADVGEKGELPAILKSFKFE